MTYEESYKYALDMVVNFLKEEDQIASNFADKGGSIFSETHPAYNLFVFIYPNLFLKNYRDEYDKIIDNQIREQVIKRVRITCLTIISLAGIEFVRKLTSNLIDGILENATNKSRALRRELVTYFENRPTTWFCILAASVFNNMLVANRLTTKKRAASLDIAQSLHTGGAV